MSNNAQRNASPALPEEKLPALKAEALRDQTLGARGLGGLDSQATLTIFAAALLAESDDGYTRDAALGILQRARKVSPQMLADAARTLTLQLGEAMKAFWNDFVKQTWQGPDEPPAYVDPAIVARRKEQEEREQEQNRKDALQYTNNAQLAVGALVIDDKEFAKPVEPAKPAPRFDVGKLLHGLLYKSPEAKPGEPPRTTAPGWLTPPLINKTDEPVMIFDNDIMAVVGGMKLSGEQAWKKLEDRGYDRHRIVQAIDSVRKVAQAQIAQCDQILAFIHSDYETHFEPVIKAAVLLGHAISVVNSFYAPLPPPSGDDTPIPPPAPSVPRRVK